MSHFTRITAEINDLDALKRAAEKMNLSLEENAPCRYYYGTQTRRYVLKLPGLYDVAVAKRIDGTYDLDADFYGGHVERFIGKRGSELLRQYSISKIEMEAKKGGYKVFKSGESTIKLIDKKTGGKAVVSIGSDGQISFDISGFKGKSCMKFKDIERALGQIEDVRKKPEFYSEAEERVHLQEEWG